jgi:hypothetical protein
LTVAELIKKLTRLPGDMEIQAVNGGWGDPVDIVGVIRGTWSPDVEAAGVGQDDAIEDYRNDEVPEFVLDDETGKIAVLVTW